MKVKFLELAVTPKTVTCSENFDLKISATNQSDQKIALQALVVTLTLDSTPSGIAFDLANVTFVTPHGWSHSHDVSSGQVRFTHQKPKMGEIGTQAFEFQIQNIMVNDKPGITGVKLDQILEKDSKGTSYNLASHVSITKISPALFLDPLRVSPGNIDYDGASTLSWNASPGATISLKLGNAPPITHVAGHPDKPLDHAGSYQFDNLTSTSSTIPMEVTATAKHASNGPITQKTFVEINAPTATMAATVTQPDQAVPVVHLDWTTTSATSRVLTSDPAGVHQPTGAPSGTAQTPFVIPTTYTFSASNPAYATPAIVTKTVTPPASAWFWVGIGPFAPENIVTIHESHKGLIALESIKSEPSNGYMYTSSDGMNWNRVTTPPIMAFGKSSFFVNDGSTTYLSTFADDRKVLIYSSVDLQNWQVLPAFPYALGESGPAPIAIDAHGTAWTYNVTVPTRTSEMKVFLLKSNDKMQSWEPVPTNFQLSEFSSPFLSASLTYFNGQLYCLGIDGGICSTDGITWSALPYPFSLGIGPSCYATVFNQQLCFFMMASYTSSVPARLGRFNADGSFHQDTPIPSFFNTTPNPFCALSVAEFNGTLFTVGNGFFTKAFGQSSGSGAGVWARTT